MSRDITKLHPLVQMLANQLVKDAEACGYKVKITDCVRTKDEQNNLSASVTNAKYPYSFHNWGLAFDICQNDAKTPYPPANSDFWKNVGLIGERLGLEWGGRWTKPVDKPHFQLDLFGTVNQLVTLYKTPDSFFKSTQYQITTPKTAINIKSSQKKVGWLQTRLCVHGFAVKIDGFFGEETCRAVNAWRKSRGGTYFLNGEVSKSECKLLARD